MTDDQSKIQAAIDFAATIKRRVRLLAKDYSISSRITVKTGVTLSGQGKTITRVLGTTNDRVIVLENGAELHSLTADAQGFQTGTPELSVVSVGSDCVVRDVVAMDGYSGISCGDAAGQSSSTFINITAHSNISRGLILDPFASKNVVRGLHSYSNGNAGFLIGHGSSENIVDDFVIEDINNASVWVQQGSFRNLVTNGIIRNPQLVTSVGINVTSHAYENTFCDITVLGYDRAIQFVGNVVDGVYPSIVDGDSWGNVAENIRGVGNAGGAGFAVSFQDASGAQTARDNIVRGCSFKDYFGVFENVSDAANGCSISEIRTSGVGAGTVMGQMKSATDVIRLNGVEGFPTKARFLSGTLDIATTGTKTTVISHGLAFTPPLSAMTVTLQRETLVTDFRLDHQWPVAVTATDITARIEVGTASATGGATARLSVMVDVQPENGFALSSIT